MIILCDYCNREFQSYGDDVCPECENDTDEENVGVEVNVEDSVEGTTMPCADDLPPNS